MRQHLGLVALQRLFVVLARECMHRGGNKLRAEAASMLNPTVSPSPLHFVACPRRTACAAGTASCALGRARTWAAMWSTA